MVAPSGRSMPRLTIALVIAKPPFDWLFRKAKRSTGPLGIPPMSKAFP